MMLSRTTEDVDSWRNPNEVHFGSNLKSSYFYAAVTLLCTVSHWPAAVYCFLFYSCDVCEAEEAKYRCPNCLKCSCRSETPNNLHGIF